MPKGKDEKNPLGAVGDLEQELADSILMQAYPDGFAGAFKTALFVVSATGKLTYLVHGWQQLVVAIAHEFDDEQPDEPALMDAIDFLTHTRNWTWARDAANLEAPPRPISLYTMLERRGDEVRSIVVYRIEQTSSPYGRLH